MQNDNAFLWERRVSFGDCDPARIAYTGRLPDFVLDAIDAFWEAHLEGDNWFRMNVDLGMGMPFVHLELDFLSPITPRARLMLHVRPQRLGTTSITFEVEAWQSGVRCFRAQTVSVFVELEGLKKIPVPPRIRAALEAAFPELTATRIAPGA